MDGGETRSGSGGPGRERERRHLPPDAPEADVLDQERDLEDDSESGPSRVPIDAPEADVLSDRESGGGERPSRIPIDAPEADFLDQTRPADLDDEGREHE
jgi:hypothetical protein